MSGDSLELPDCWVLRIGLKSLQDFVVCHHVLIFIIIDADSKLDVLWTIGCCFLMPLNEVNYLGSTNIPFIIGLKKESPTDEVSVMDQSLVVI